MGRRASLLLGGLAVFAGCSFDWDAFDPRADGGAEVTSAGVGGTGAGAGGTSTVSTSTVGVSTGGADGSGGTMSAGGSMNTCPQTLCGMECVDLDSDPMHCGDCDEVCPPTEQCIAGSCTAESCSALLSAEPGSGDGLYTIAPGGGAPIQVHCDMTIQGGGWTLVASVVDNSFFVGSVCSTACGMSPPTAPCDETPFSSTTVAGSASTMLTSDHKSAAYSNVPFTEMLFVDSNGNYATYEVSGTSVQAWYPAGLQNWVTMNVEVHPTFSYPVKTTNVDASENQCGTLRLAINTEDSDSPIGGSCHHSVKGPVWSRREGSACFWEDSGVRWAASAFFQDNATSYRLWLVR